MSQSRACAPIAPPQINDNSFEKEGFRESGGYWICLDMICHLHDVLTLRLWLALIAFSYDRLGFIDVGSTEMCKVSQGRT